MSGISAFLPGASHRRRRALVARRLLFLEGLGNDLGLRHVGLEDGRRRDRGGFFR
jgi:hypothetical protein